MNRPIRQLGALAVALVLIVAAIIVRDRLDGDDPESTGDAIQLLCDPLLADACAGVAGATVKIEDPSVTMDRLVEDGPLNADAWVTSDLWTSIAADRLSNLTWLTAKASVLGAATPILVGQRSRLDPLAASCSADPLTWRCVGDNAGKTWAEVGVKNLPGKITIGYPPTTTTIGLANIAAIVSSYFNSTTYPSNDLQDDQFQDWYARLKGTLVDRGSENETPLQKFLPIRANYGVVGDLSTSRPTIDGIADPSTLRVDDSTPTLRVRAVIAAPTREDLPTDRLIELLRPTWSADPEAGSLPSGGVLDALRSL